MKKRMIALLLAVGCVLSLMCTGIASYTQEEKTADALNELDLFRGKGTAGYDLDANLTRAEGATLLVRVLGKEDEAKNWPLKIPFMDVPAWAIGYVGYAAAHGITNGTSPTTFAPNDELKDYMFLTLVLRALGYTDQGANAAFVWNNPYALANNVGLIDKVKADASFTRGDAVEILWNAMGIRLVGSNKTLADSLIEQEVFTKAEFNKAMEIQKIGRKESAGVPVVRPENSNADATEIYPWEKPGAKQPKDYTWAEFEVLTGTQQLAFQKWFESQEAFSAWMENVQHKENGSSSTGGSNTGNKTTWAEFEAMSMQQQMEFQSSFGSIEAFEAWMENAQAEENRGNWVGKLPVDYTWAEFERLSGEQQMAFQNWFGSASAFESWMNEAQEEASRDQWTGSKKPSDYTWSEFNALSAEQQMAFQNWFGSTSAFERWMEEARAEEETDQWTGKAPTDYTWAEFEALTGEEQMIFQNWFMNNGLSFEDWMYEAMGM